MENMLKYCGTIVHLEGCHSQSPPPITNAMAARLAELGPLWKVIMRIQTLRLAFAISVICASVVPVTAQVANPELEARRSTGLLALRERDPAIKDVSFEVDGMTVAKANTKVEDTPIKTIVIGNAYLEKGKTRAGPSCA